MCLSSKRIALRVLAVALTITLLGFGVPALQAKTQKGCTVQAQCPAPVVMEKPQLPAETCCPVDPKDVKKAQKEAEHAQHEAAEACKRQQREVAEQQARIDRAYARAQHEIGERNAKLNHELSEMQAAQEALANLTNGSQPQSISPPQERTTE